MLENVFELSDIGTVLSCLGNDFVFYPDFYPCFVNVSDPYSLSSYLYGSFYGQRLELVQFELLTFYDQIEKLDWLRFVFKLTESDFRVGDKSG